MSISRLSTASMLHVLEFMLEGEPRKLLASNDLLAPMLSRMEKAHKDLVASRGEVRSPLSPEEERRLRMELGQLDQEHDSAARFLYGLLQLAESNAPTPLEQTTLAALREDLFPFGMQIVRMKWVDEAGEASRLNEQISSKEVRDLLSSVAFFSPGIQITALQLAQQLTDVGLKMSEKLVQLTNTEGPGGPTLETLAKRQFTKVLTRLKVIAELEWENQPEHFTTTFKALQEQLDGLTASTNPAGQENPTPQPPAPTPGIPF